MEQGGAILHDDHMLDAFYRQLRFDGRDEDGINTIGYHCPMLPSVAAQGILRLAHLSDDARTVIDYMNYPNLADLDIVWSK